MLALWGLSKVVKLLESRGSMGRGNDSLDMSGSAGYFVIGKGENFEANEMSNRKMILLRY